MVPVATDIELKQARAFEQALIIAYTPDALNNSIKSISPKKFGKFEYEFYRVINLPVVTLMIND